MKIAFPQRNGVALIIVLSILAILMALVLAFFALVQTERQSSSLFAESVEVRTLAEIPVNLAIGQIRKATENNGPTLPTMPSVVAETQFKSWASQPGMIRVFGVESDSNLGVRSKATALYKLYSDDKMVEIKPGANSLSSGLSKAEVVAALKADTDDLADWDEKPGMFVDLNEPVPVPPTGTSTLPSYKFPIVDPRASVAGASGELPVAGFSYTVTGVAKTVAATGRTDVNARLPMPVRWIYVLRDGSLVTPASGDDKKTTFTAGTGAPTATNPIVGRIAFWTDDDSCKVNINTATEGVHWDMPVANSQTEKEYALRIPAQNEFSRYPGHPSATCLSPILQAAGADFIVDETLPQSKFIKAHELIHQLSPRVSWGGTMAGTQPPTAAAALKEERLYASVDELFFNRERTQNTSGLDAGDLDLSRFFLTAHSRAPELNLFGKPRISLWTVSKNTADRNAKDKLVAFLCETTGTGTREWCIQRSSNFTGPGTIAAAGSSQHPTDDYDKSKTDRNLSMYESYLRVLTGENSGGVFNMPGFTNAATFRTKYGVARRDQMLAECVDLLRWGVNSYSSVTGEKNYYYLPRRGGSNPNNRGQSTAVPLEIRQGGVAGGTALGRGFGRWPTITEATIVFMRVAPIAPSTEPHIQAFLVLEPFNPTCGPASMTPNIIYRVKDLDRFMVNTTTPLGFPAIADNLCQATDGTIGGAGSGSTPYAGFMSQFATPSGAAKTAGTTNPGNNYPFVSQPVKITGPNFQFTGGMLTVETYPGWTGTVSGTPIQTIKLWFPPITQLKLPSTTAKMTVDARIADPKALRDNLILLGDITRSVEASSTGPAKGDLRHFAAARFVPETWFTTHPEYPLNNFAQLHFLRHGAYTDGGQFGQYAAFPPSPFGAQGVHPNTNDTAGSLVKDVTYSKQCPPAVPRGLLAAENSNGRPGDWDNGVGIIEDGPYIRKPDEGNLESGSGVSPYLDRHTFTDESGKTYSPNRQICSAVAFGSLPTGVTQPTSTTPNPSLEPWQTLLFCPNPPSRATNALSEPTATDHKGFQAPRDHLLLDLFWMPIVDPYAISEPLSTAGKINLNYQMAPFSHIERSTGIHAALKSTRITAISPSSVGGLSAAGYNQSGRDVYKAAANSAANTHTYELRYAVNAEATLDGFRNRFSQGDVFRSASEICEIFLVPKRLSGASYASDAKLPPSSGYAGMTDWWNGNVGSTDAFELTGDNTREAPYNHLYPRLTTKSNTFTVHYRVQSLQKARSTSPTEWVEGKDSVRAEFRGSTTLERYLDPNDTETGPLMVGGGTFKNTWDVLYRMRIIQRKQFVP